MHPKDRPAAAVIRDSLIGYSKRFRHLPGIVTDAALDAFLEQVVESERRVRFLEYIASKEHDPESANPESVAFDPLKAATQSSKQGDFENACWLVFLATHFGRTRKNKWRVVANVYGGLGRSTPWTWEDVVDSTAFPAWIDRNGELLGAKTGPSFGNHRKYESLRSNARRSLRMVIESYLNLVRSNVSHAELLRCAVEEAAENPGKTFDILYRKLTSVLSFGRIGAFDYLSTMGRLKLMPIVPAKPYFEGASGPLKGAKLLFLGSANAAKSARDLSAMAIDLGRACSIRMDVMEDALCNWQKNPTRFVFFRG